MALELDTRQRAMLQEMGLQVWLPDAGVAVLERSPQPAAAPVRAAVPSRAAPARPSGAAPLVTQSVAPHAASLDWSELSDAVRACHACTLCAGRSHSTLLAPAPDQAPCDWLVLGDPPDEDEDRAGAPFAGQDGLLLTHMLRALGLQRANPLPRAAMIGRADSAGAAASAAVPVLSGTPAQRAYVSNVLKCRPAHGAIAQAAELSACSAWLQREIALVQPKIILSLGRFANQLLLGETPALAALPLGKLRGTVHRYLGLPVVVSYPPKLLMRNGADKAKAWADLCLGAATVEAIKLGR